MKRTEKVARHKDSGHRKQVRYAKKLSHRQMRRQAKRDPADALRKIPNYGWWD